MCLELFVDRQKINKCRQIYVWLACDGDKSALGGRSEARMAALWSPFGLTCARLITPKALIAGSRPEGLVRLIARTEGLLRGNRMWVWKEPANHWSLNKRSCIWDKFGGAQIKADSKNDRQARGSLTDDLRLFDQPSGGTLGGLILVVLNLTNISSSPSKANMPTTRLYPL